MVCSTAWTNSGAESLGEDSSDPVAKGVCHLLTKSRRMSSIISSMTRSRGGVSLCFRDDETAALCGCRAHCKRVRCADQAAGVRKARRGRDLRLLRDRRVRRNVRMSAMWLANKKAANSTTVQLIKSSGKAQRKLVQCNRIAALKSNGGASAMIADTASGERSIPDLASSPRRIDPTWSADAIAGCSKLDRKLRCEPKLSSDKDTYSDKTQHNMLFMTIVCLWRGQKRASLQQTVLMVRITMV